MLEITPPKDLKKGLGLSFALHVFILALFMTKMFLVEPELDLSQAISVQMGDLKENEMPQKQTSPQEAVPEKAEKPVAEPAKAEEKPAKKETAKPEPTPAKTDEVKLTKNRANKQKEALQRLKKMSAIDKIKQDLKNDSINKIRKSVVAHARVAGSGGALTGLDKLQADDYLQEIDKSIKQFWTLPQWLVGKPLKTKVLVKVNAQGQVTSSKVVSSSGNSSYDNYCISAVEKSSPFPKVPEKLAGKFSADGIIIGFPE